MNRVWYDTDADVIWVSNRADPFQPRTLEAVVVDGEIRVRRKGQVVSVTGGRFDEIGDGVGNGFADMASAMAYLDAVFSRRREAYVLVQDGIAAAPLGGHRAVARGLAGIVHASADDPATVDAVLGVTLGAADAGAAPQIVPSGPIREPSWSWAPGPVFLGLDGALTQTAPSRGAVLQVATAISPTCIFVALQEPFHLAA